MSLIFLKIGCFESYFIKKIFIQMIAKWTQKEDQQLVKIVRRFGTNWTLVRKHFKSNRSRDSVIKRWHGRLKYWKSKAQMIKNTVEVIQKAVATPAKRRSRIFQAPKVVKSKRIAKLMRSSMQPVNLKNKNKFQRLRSFLDVPKGIRRTRSKITNEPKVELQSKPRQQPQRDISSREQPKKDQTQKEDSNYIFVKDWTKNDDEKLRLLVIQQGVLSWQKIAQIMQCGVSQVQNRWRRVVYHLIKMEDKVGGFLKYSNEQDLILTMAYRLGLSWTQMGMYLPGRSEFSIQARWRRLIRPEVQVQLSKNKHYLRKEFLKKIVQKKRSTKQPITEQEQKKQFKVDKVGNTEH